MKLSDPGLSFIRSSIRIERKCFLSVHLLHNVYVSVTFHYLH